MKQVLSVSAALACAFLALPAQAQQAADNAPSIASKIEEQGAMRYLKVSDLRAVRRDGLLRVQAEISNSSSSTQQLYYRFKWLDADGFTVWDEEPWKPQVIYGAQKQVISVVAPTFKATDFRLILQSPSNSGFNQLQQNSSPTY